MEFPQGWGGMDIFWTNTFENLFPLFQWHACKLAKLSACIAKCMTTKKRIYFILFYIYIYVYSDKCLSVDSVMSLLKQISQFSCDRVSCRLTCVKFANSH